MSMCLWSVSYTNLTPCNAEGKVNPAVLVAAKEAGADEVYKAGGAQAIAALAFGTESIPKVDKIVGPGNIYVALAKKVVYGHVSIDSIAGPSEILVLADETANPRYVAADLLSQAEHDELASAILITTSEDFAKKVSEEVEGFVQVLERKAIIQKSLDNFGSVSYTHLDVYKRQGQVPESSPIETAWEPVWSNGEETLCLLYTSRCV